MDALAPLLPERGFSAWLLRILFGRRQAGQAGERLARALVSMGPAYVKLGQILSTRPDLIGESVARDLTRLQDQLDPLPEPLAKQSLETALGQPLEQAFARFDMKPLSAASLAQVHGAQLHDGREVVVKLLRPDAQRAFQADVRALAAGGRWAQRLGPGWLSRLKPRELGRMLENQAVAELDMRLEAAAMGRLADQLSARKDVAIPQPIWELTGPSLLTMTRLDFISMDEAEAMLAEGLDLSQVLTSAAQIFFESLFEHGYFHGDQHAGNMGVTSDGRIALVDFGIMGHVSLKDRFFLADLMAALLARRYEAVAELYAASGYLSEEKDQLAFSLALRALCEPLMDKPLGQLSFAELLGQLLSMNQRFSLELDPALYLLQKNMLMAEGISRQLDPNLNIWQLAEPLVADWMRRHRGPEALLSTFLNAIFKRLAAELDP